MNPRAIEAGAEALRQLEQGGKRLNEWSYAAARELATDYVEQYGEPRP